MTAREPLLAQLARARDEVTIAPARPTPSPSVDDLVAAIRAAVDLRDDEAAAEQAWTRAGALHDPEALDQALARIAPTLGVPILSGMRRRRLRDAARQALRATRSVGALRLLAAVLGAVGASDDAAALELIASHPALTLHGATALANLNHWEGRASLLRVLSRVNGAERVLVIDRLLPFVREPAVRLALVRDAFIGLGDEYAREIAPAVVDRLDLASWLDEERTSEELRAAARHILHLAGRDAP